jgi:glyoxylase I family protein
MAIDVTGMTPLIYVFDMPTSLAFYTDVLGFSVEETAGRGPAFEWASLRLNDVTLMLNSLFEGEARPAYAEPPRVEAHGDTTFYFRCPDVDGAYQELLARGAKVSPPEVAPYGLRQVYVTDPDGYSLCFQWPTTQAGLDHWARH